MLWGYDAYGNLLDDGQNIYTYDPANRLNSVTDGVVTTSYIYNGDSDRIAQTVDGTTTTYLLDTATPLTMVLSETTGTDTIFYLHGLDLEAESDGAATDYFNYDGLGSVRQLADEASNTLLAQTFDPYGNPYASAGTGTSSFGFAGEQSDVNSLLYLRARYYSPSQGRFVNMDPWSGDPRQPHSLNPYLYGLGNPILHTDPSGRCAVCAPLGVAFIVAGSSWLYAEITYDLMISGKCGCELQQRALSMGRDRYRNAIIGQALIGTGLAVIAVETGPVGLAVLGGAGIVLGYEQFAREAVQGFAYFNETGEVNPCSVLNASLGLAGTLGGAFGVRSGLRGIRQGSPADTPAAELSTPIVDEAVSASEVRFGGGTRWSHFTNAEGVRGITGIDPETIPIGEEVIVRELRFGTGQNPYLAANEGDIFVTDLPADVPSRQLNQIGIPSDKQSFVIQFSQEATVYNGVRPEFARRGIFTIPANTTYSGATASGEQFYYVVKRVR